MYVCIYLESFNFQSIVSVFYDSFILSDQDTNQFLV